MVIVGVSVRAVIGGMIDAIDGKANDIVLASVAGSVVIGECV